MNQDSAKPEERHKDLLELANAIHTAKTAVLVAFIPFMLAGVGMLVANHFGQKHLTEQTAQMANEIADMRKEFKATNEKVIVMWANGEWNKKFLQTPPNN